MTTIEETYNEIPDQAGQEQPAAPQYDGKPDQAGQEVPAAPQYEKFPS